MAPCQVPEASPQRRDDNYDPLCSFWRVPLSSEHVALHRHHHRDRCHTPVRGEGTRTLAACPVATQNGFSGQKWPCWSQCLLILILISENLQVVGNPAPGADTWQCPSPTPSPWGFRVQGTGSEVLGDDPSLWPCLFPAQRDGVAASQAPQ